MSLVTPPVRSGFPIVDRILEGGAPDAVRAAAARGALPLPREALTLVLVHLAHDPSESIRTDALETLEKTSPEDLNEILGNPGTDLRVLSFYSEYPRLFGEPLVSLIGNPALGEEDLVRIATRGSSAAIDTLLLNQERLVSTPAAIEALSANSGLNADQRRRLLDFAEHFGHPAAAPGEGAPRRRAEGLDPELLGPVSEAELRGLLGELGDLPFINLEVGELHGEVTPIEIGEDFDLADDAFESVYMQILRMNPAQRLRAALRGGREVRAILSRDSNRAVSSGVLKNAKLTEEEIIQLTAQRTVGEHLLRLISGSRAWMSSYQVVVNLVRNPKTPQAIAMNHVLRLQTRDLTLMSRDRNVADVIRQMARRQLDLRQPKTRVGRKH